MRGVVVFLGLWLSACATTGRPAPDNRVQGLSDRNDVWRIHFVDVGQGLSVLLEFPCAAVLIDTGGEENSRFRGVDALGAYLDHFFERREDLQRTLALLVLTHPHVDHTRGVPMVLDRFRVKNLLHNGMRRGSGGDEQTEAIQWAAKHADEVGVRAIRVGALPPGGLTDDVIDPVACTGIDPRLRVLWGGMETDPGWGMSRYGRAKFQNANNHSIVLRVDFGRASGLFVGDIDRPAISELLKRTAGTGLLDVDVYQVAHHGSSNGTTPELVAAMTPEIAVFSAGPAHRHVSWSGWQHGHPRMPVVSMLEEQIVRRRKTSNVLVAFARKSFTNHVLHRALYNTGWDGTVVIEARADGAMRVVTQH